MISKIEVVGCGGAFSPELGNSSFLLWRDKGFSGAILFDCGGDVFAKLKNKGYLEAIDTVVVSHFHGDHAGSLDTLIYWNFFVMKRKLKIYSDAFDIYKYLSAIDKNLLDMIFVSSLDQECLLRRTEHVCGMNCYYAQIYNVLISGDTRVPVIGMITSDVVLHEVCFGPKYEGMVHTHFDDLITEVPKDIRKKYWLYHYNVGDVEKYNDMVVVNGFAGLLVPWQMISLGE